MNSHPKRLIEIASQYAADYAAKMQLGIGADQRCEWSCILWSTDHWAKDAEQAQLLLQQTKDKLVSPVSTRIIEEQVTDTHFRNTVSQVYSRLFNDDEKTCDTKLFASCPHMKQREQLLRTGALAGIFVTILHKAVSYSMLDRHPLDSGLLHEDYTDAYGVDLSTYDDLTKSLNDGRFEELYDNVLRKALQLSGLYVATGNESKDHGKT